MEIRDKTDEAFSMSPGDARTMIRNGRWTDLTESVAQPYVHLAPLVLSRADAYDVLLHGVRNPLATPIVEVLDEGAWASRLALSGDVRTDVARYQVWKNGELVDEPTDLLRYWRSDLVTILIGTSHILGAALKGAGIPNEVVDNPRPAIYKTAQSSQPAGRLCGPVYVTVKFAPPELVSRIIQVSSKLPSGHGAPIHIGDPAAIGVEGDRPAFGAVLEIPNGTVPLFWACGYSLMAALREAPVDWYACHSPGCTFITDARWEEMLV